MSRLRGNEANSFAQVSILVRLPNIIHKAVDTLRSMSNFQSIKGCDRDQAIRELEVLADNIANNRHLPEHKEDIKETNWLDSPWLAVECLCYIEIQRITNHLKIDLFYYLKDLALLHSKATILFISSTLLQSQLEQLLILSLWGNLSDLSLSFDTPQLPDTNERIISNHSSKVIPVLLRAKVISIVLDNSGLELYCDLCLLSFLTRSLGIQVNIYVKSFPWFVSDTTTSDIHTLFAFCSEIGLESQVLEMQTFLKEKKWIIIDDPFFTTSISYRSMPLKLREDLALSDLVIMKGDLNYRKLIDDRKYPMIKGLDEVIDEIPLNFPCLLLRVCKSDCCIGLEESILENLTDPNWCVSGKYGVIQFCESMPHANRLDGRV